MGFFANAENMPPVLMALGVASNRPLQGVLRYAAFPRSFPARLIVAPGILLPKD
jgi:hypothetical protein